MPFIGSWVPCTLRLAVINYSVFIRRLYFLQHFKLSFAFCLNLTVKQVLHTLRWKIKSKNSHRHYVTYFALTVHDAYALARRTYMLYLIFQTNQTCYNLKLYWLVTSFEALHFLFHYHKYRLNEVVLLTSFKRLRAMQDTNIQKSNGPFIKVQQFHKTLRNEMAHEQIQWIDIFSMTAKILLITQASIETLNERFWLRLHEIRHDRLWLHGFY